MRKATFFYLLRRGLLTGAGGFIRDGLVMASKFITQGLTHPAQGSAEFDGSSDYIIAPRPLDGTLSDYTISFWMNASTGTPVAFGTDGDTSNYALAYSNASLMRWEVRGTFGTKTITSTINPFTSDWIHVAIQVDNNTGTFYFDGSADSSASAGPIDFSGNFFIGRYGGTALKLNGNLANVAIWNRALSSDEINSAMWKGYDALEASEKSGLQAWYSLDDVASPAASLATMEALAVDKDATIENKAAVTAAINALS